MDKYHFSTVVSKDHLYKFIAMYISLKTHCRGYKLYVLCAHDVVYDILKAIQFEDVVLFKLNDIENEKLLEAKANRIFHAYCWTLKPVFMHFVMKNFAEANYFAHLDADLCFYSSPFMIFTEKPDASLFLTHHRNSEMFNAFYDITGIYNTGFVGARQDRTAVAAITKWKDQCIENCPIKEDPANKLFGDQRYVEGWEAEFGNVHVVESVGVNAALWNISNYTVTKKESHVYLDDQPLIFYHFSGLSILGEREFNLCWYYKIEDEETVNLIYKPYLILLSNAVHEMARYFPKFREGIHEWGTVPDTHHYELKILDVPV